MVSSLRRLAADHAALRASDLPPYYLFPLENDPASSSDDLSQLTILLAGPQGTPYSQGLWRLHLKMPGDYPKSPPKATFRTRIWHPNVEESTGTVCVDTLKRDWESKLTLKDVLVTISCLLINPNPDSALNPSAGALLQEDYDGFARKAKMMTSIHAPVPEELNSVVREAKLRGEDAGTVIQEKEQEQSRPSQAQKGTRVHSLRMKAKPTSTNETSSHSRSTNLIQGPSSHHQHQHQTQETTYSTISDSEDEDLTSATKENDPSLSPSPVKLAPPSPRKNAHGKRPLSVLSMPLDPDIDHQDYPNEVEAMTESEKNIAANEPDSGPQRKSPKLSILNRSANFARPGDELTIFEDPDPFVTHGESFDGKENQSSSAQAKPQSKNQHHSRSALSSTSKPSASTSTSTSTSKKSITNSRTAPSTSSSSSSKRKPRIGIRRL